MRSSRDVPVVVSLVAMMGFLGLVFLSPPVGPLETRVLASMYALAITLVLAATMMLGIVAGPRGILMRAGVLVAMFLLGAILCGVLWIDYWDVELDHGVTIAWGGMPLSTSLFLYGLWSLGLVMLVMWTRCFSRGIYGSAEEQLLAPYMSKPDAAPSAEHLSPARSEVQHDQ